MRICSIGECMIELSPENKNKYVLVMQVTQLTQQFI